MLVRRFRVLRLKYRISLVELSRATGVSPQRISELELSDTHITDATVQKLLTWLETVIRQRNSTLLALTDDYQKHRHCLMDLVGETSHAI